MTKKPLKNPPKTENPKDFFFNSQTTILVLCSSIYLIVSLKMLSFPISRENIITQLDMDFSKLLHNQSTENL